MGGRGLATAPGVAFRRLDAVQHRGAHHTQGERVEGAGTRLHQPLGRRHHHHHILHGHPEILGAVLTLVVHHLRDQKESQVLIKVDRLGKIIGHSQIKSARFHT